MCTSTRFPEAIPLRNIPTSALTIDFVLMFLKGIASGKRVEVHTNVKRYSFPDLVRGKGPTQSISILLKGSSKAGIGCY